VVEGVDLALPECNAPNNDLAEITSYTPNTIEIDTQSECSSLLVLSDLYDPNWNAYVDGKEKEIIRTDYLLRGIPLPEGEHTISLEYEPSSFRIGLIISGATLLLLVTIPVAKYLIKRRSPDAK
jgi:uncharacterized membrane protein YfhO